ncbi:MAG: hydroxymethylbilane synthase, partial [Dehalococcoidia bacterium]|nr:hydroxymethylbilane synthase [Dehalococcoidia bacterium]
MKTGKRIIVGTRSSKLATIQAEGVLAKLQWLNPEYEFSLATIITRGDRER